MIDLLESRDKIDKIDMEIVRLFEERMKICEDVAEYKIATGKKVLDAERERQKLKALRGRAHGEFNQLGTQELFEQIMAISRKRQYQLLTEHGVEDEEKLEMVDSLPLNNVTVVFQGVEGAYSYAAMREYFDDDIKSFHVKTWRDAMEAVVEGKADYGVLPIENSTAGIVAGIYDLLTEYDLNIVGEQIISPRHVLLGLPEASLEEKIRAVVQRVYHGADIALLPAAKKQLDQLTALGFGALPVCMAKTQYSFSDDPAKLGAPEGFTVTVKQVKVSAGAGFVVVLTGDILTMPGLPRVPAAEGIDVDENGRITGLF